MQQGITKRLETCPTFVQQAEALQNFPKPVGCPQEAQRLQQNLLLVIE
tara:strand:- start:130 stop:273 length:144 start_codon:yes stop_codon:yes gene_type:complete